MTESSVASVWHKSLANLPLMTVDPLFPSFLIRRKLITRNSSGDEIANVNFLYNDIVHAVQNTIDSCINSAIDRRGVLEHWFRVYQIQ